jgi:hypothetical protein
LLSRPIGLPYKQALKRHGTVDKINVNNKITTLRDKSYKGLYQITP